MLPWAGDGTPEMTDFAFKAILVYASYSYLIFTLGLAGLCTRPWISASLIPPVALCAWFLRRGMPNFRPRLRAHGPFLIGLGIAALVYSTPCSSRLSPATT